MEPDDLLILFQSITNKLIDKYAPVKTTARRVRNTNVWLNEECRQAKKKTRRLERLYKTKGKVRTEGNRQAWLTLQRESHQLFKTTKSKYWRDRIESEQSNPRQL